jgi:PIN domain nuclease of toxin-antitoxin system
VRILLDTHILMWALIEPNRLPPIIRSKLEDPSHEVIFSVASIWEIAIKAGLGKSDFRVALDEIVETAHESGFVELPINVRAALRVQTLPHHHRDPFDRLLVAQAMCEPAVLYTADPQLAAYSELVELI